MKIGNFNNAASWLPEPIPIEQGLKHIQLQVVWYLIELPEPIPIEQGLKLTISFFLHRLKQLPEPIPIEQGLKPGILTTFIQLRILFQSLFRLNKD